MKYRKKPVVVDAVLFDGKIIGEPDGKGGVVPGTCPDWIWSPVPVTHPANTWAGPGQIFYAGDILRIGSREGGATASPGDYIIRDVKGELRPCKPDIFAATYEAVL